MMQVGDSIEVYFKHGGWTEANFTFGGLNPDDSHMVVVKGCSVEFFWPINKVRTLTIRKR